jgi:hypothetical protein
MGNDGGSIPTRRELVKSAARNPTVSELKATALESLSHAWTNDPLTSEPLDMEGVVSDWRGRLYNYESILKALIPNDDDSVALSLDDAESPELTTFASTGIKSLRDVVKLKFKRYSPPGHKGKEIWACPVSLKELGASTKAVYLVPCGHVFADMAIKQIQEEACPECSEPFKAEHVIPILSTEKSELQRLATRLDDLKARGMTHNLKKDKSAGKKKRKAEDSNGDNGPKGKANEGSKTQSKTGKADISSRINNPMTASLTARVLAEQEENNKRRKILAAR